MLRGQGQLLASAGMLHRCVLAAIGRVVAVLSPLRRLTHCDMKTPCFWKNGVGRADVPRLCAGSRVLGGATVSPPRPRARVRDGFSDEERF
jgi:hypothetical protein